MDDFLYIYPSLISLPFTKRRRRGPELNRGQGGGSGLLTAKGGRMNARNREKFLILARAVAVNASIHWQADDPDRREEQTQEAIAHAWLIFRSAALRGRADCVHAGSISRYAVSLVDEGRLAAGTSSGDVLARQKCIVESLNREVLTCGDDGPELMPVASTLTDKRTDRRPDRSAQLRGDYGDFEASDLLTLTAHGRDVLRMLGMGFKNMEIAQTLGLSNARITQIIGQIGEALAAFFSWPPAASPVHRGA
jgi:hypothetical protein